MKSVIHHHLLAMAMNIYIKSLFVIMITGFATTAFAQETQAEKDATAKFQRQKQFSFYKILLQVDSIKAEQVLQVQETYKTNIQLIMADTALRDPIRSVKIKGLIDGKNQQLKSLLTPDQQRKIIPTAEITPVEPPKNN